LQKGKKKLDVNSIFGENCMILKNLGKQPYRGPAIEGKKAMYSQYIPALNSSSDDSISSSISSSTKFSSILTSSSSVSPSYIYNKPFMLNLNSTKILHQFC
jgi:hypothetical protein